MLSFLNLNAPSATSEDPIYEQQPQRASLLSRALSLTGRKLVQAESPQATSTTLPPNAIHRKMSAPEPTLSLSLAGFTDSGPQGGVTMQRSISDDSSLHQSTLKRSNTVHTTTTATTQNLDSLMKDISSFQLSTSLEQALEAKMKSFELAEQRKLERIKRRENAEEERERRRIHEAREKAYRRAFGVSPSPNRGGVLSPDSADEQEYGRISYDAGDEGGSYNGRRRRGSWGLRLPPSSSKSQDNRGRRLASPIDENVYLEELEEQESVVPSSVAPPATVSIPPTSTTFKHESVLDVIKRTASMKKKDSSSQHERAISPRRFGLSPSSTTATATATSAPTPITHHHLIHKHETLDLKHASPSLPSQPCSPVDPNTQVPNIKRSNSLRNAFSIFTKKRINTNNAGSLTHSQDLSSPQPESLQSITFIRPTSPIEKSGSVDLTRSGSKRGTQRPTKAESPAASTSSRSQLDEEADAGNSSNSDELTPIEPRSEGRAAAARRPPRITTAVDKPTLVALSLSPDLGPTSAGSDGGSGSGRKSATKGSQYLCPVCSQGFSRKDHLRRHNKAVHEGIKPFHCTHCKRDFGRSDEARRHMRMHGKRGDADKDAMICNPPHPSSSTPPAVPSLKRKPNSAGVGTRTRGVSRLNSAGSVIEKLEFEEPESAKSAQQYNLVSPFSGGTETEGGDIEYEFYEEEPKTSEMPVITGEPLTLNLVSCDGLYNCQVQDCDVSLEYEALLAHFESFHGMRVLSATQNGVLPLQERSASNERDAPELKNESEECISMDHQSLDATNYPEYLPENELPSFAVPLPLSTWSNTSTAPELLSSSSAATAGLSPLPYNTSSVFNNNSGLQSPNIYSPLMDNFSTLRFDSRSNSLVFEGPMDGLLAPIGINGIAASPNFIGSPMSPGSGNDVTGMPHLSYQWPRSGPQSPANPLSIPYQYPSVPLQPQQLSPQQYPARGLRHGALSISSNTSGSCQATSSVGPPLVGGLIQAVIIPSSRPAAFSTDFGHVSPGVFRRRGSRVAQLVNENRPVAGPIGVPLLATNIYDFGPELSTLDHHHQMMELEKEFLDVEGNGSSS
ncbi:UNVERIFIED_CONTAM: hypothetical protein HDU68_012575 [Siphonaria sp. JEL0065]|nr:hypothetical protein HDU68_012575 [Siphonaria sp. JEL0065]